MSIFLVIALAILLVLAGITELIMVIILFGCFLDAVDDHNGGMALLFGGSVLLILSLIFIEIWAILGGAIWQN